jgi:UDP-glucuronate decarboxylase
MQALSGKPLTLYGSGTQTRSFCFVSDLVRGLSLLMDAPDLSGAVVNLGSPDEVTMLEIATTILELTGSRSGIVYEPLPADDPARRRPDVTKARELLGWEPQVSLRDGLISTLDGFRLEIAREHDAEPRPRASDARALVSPLRAT